MNICTGTHLSRRTLLRGLGVALALPLLDAMRPAFAREPAAGTGPKRFVAICSTLGFHLPNLVPAKTGRDHPTTRYLTPLEAHRGRYTVLSGLSHAEQNGANGHSSDQTWLTAAKHPGLVGFRNSISVDQVMAAQLGPATRVPYLACSTGGGSMSWTAGGVEIPGDNSPARLFARLFIQGTPEEVQAQKRSLQRGRSVLDTIAGQARRLVREVGARDREKLDQYLTSVRDLETDLTQSQAWLERPKPMVDLPAPKDITERSDLIGRIAQFYDLITLALQTDSTRVVTLRFAGVSQVLQIEGVRQVWHHLTHHSQNAEKIAELSLVEDALFGAFARFIDRLHAVREGGGTLLDRTAVLFGSNLSSASAHDWRNLPLVLVGGGFTHAGHLAFPANDNLPFSNLLLQNLHRMGIAAERFGQSTAATVPGLA